MNIGSSDDKMAILLLSILINGFAVSRSADVPLLAWSSNSSCCINIEDSSIGAVKPSVIAELFMNMIEAKYQIIIFVEEFFAVEDFLSSTKYDNGPFYNLKEMYSKKKFLYFPRVSKPLDSLNAIPTKYSVKKYNISEYTDYGRCENSLLTEIINEKRNVIIMHMDDSDEKSRDTLLREHDKMMSKICNCIEKYYELLCVLTGLHGLEVKGRLSNEVDFASGFDEAKNKTQNSTNNATMLSSRIKQMVIDDSTVNHCEKNCLYKDFDKKSTVMIYVTIPPNLSYDDKLYGMVNYQSSVTTVNDSYINLKMKNENASLLFNFVKRSDDYWELKDVLAKVGSNVVPMTSEVPIEARAGHSFVCGDTEFVGDKAKLSLSRIQVEPFFPRFRRQVEGGEAPAGEAQLGETQPSVQTQKSGAAPETGGAAPETGGAVPETGGATPETGGAAPETGGAVPQTGGAAPEPKHIRRKEAQPETVEETPCGTFDFPDQCIPFQSITVFMAYIVTGALVLILTWAVGMIQTIGRNDRFDADPQKMLMRD